MGRRRRRHGKRGTDFISDLPDHLLHSILVRLKSVSAVARTSVLSSRWRRVWEDLPELVYSGYDDDEPQYYSCIDAALEAYSAPTVSVLDISVPTTGIDYVPQESVDAWMRFASQRVTGTFALSAYNNCRRSTIAEIYLPPCERAKSIDIDIGPGDCLLRFPSTTGTFAALTKLRLEISFMEAHELEALVSSCPRLTDLAVITALFVRGSDSDTVIDNSTRPSILYHFKPANKVVPNFSIRSSYLKRLEVHLCNVQRLDIIAPMLQVLTARSMYDVVYVSAPELAEVDVRWLHLYHFTDARRHLRWLKVDEYSSVMQSRRFLTRRFLTVDDLTLHAYPETDQYNRFLDVINNLPKCEILRVSMRGNDHGFVPCMLQILRKANGIRKFVLDSGCSVEYPTCSLTCPCRLPETSNTDITFASLEEIEVDYLYEEDDRLDFLELLLSRCSAPKLSSLRIITTRLFVPTPGNEAVEKLRSMCPPNVRLTITRGPKIYPRTIY